MDVWSKRFVTAVAAMTAAVLSVGSAAGAAEQQRAEKTSRGGVANLVAIAL